MSAGDSIENGQNPVSNEFAMREVFTRLESRFNQAVEKQNRNIDSAYYGVELIGDHIFYVLTFADSYRKIVTAAETSDIFEVLIPGFETSTVRPFAEQLTNNPGAYFFLRRYDTDGSEHLVLVRPFKIETITEKVSAVIGGADRFFPGTEPVDIPFSLLSKLDTFELIPAGVVPHYSSVERAIRELGE